MPPRQPKNSDQARLAPVRRQSTATVTAIAVGLLVGIASLADPQPVAAKPGGPWLSDLAAAREQAKTSGKPILVDMYAQWCGWCKVLDEKVFSTPEFHLYAKKFVLLHVDTEDGGDGTMLSGRHGGDSLPVTLVLRHDLVEMGRVPGYAPREEMIRRIDAELERWELLDKDYQQALAGKAEVDPRAVAEELHRRGDGQRAANLYRQLANAPGTDTTLAGWTRYLLADALRMAGDYPGASREIAEAKRLAGDKGAAQLIERLDLLTVQVAEDRGDCRSQMTALESFLSQHPKSDYSYRAKRTLQALKSEGGSRCG